MCARKVNLRRSLVDHYFQYVWKNLMVFMHLMSFRASTPWWSQCGRKILYGCRDWFQRNQHFFFQVHMTQNENLQWYLLYCVGWDVHVHQREKWKKWVGVNRQCLMGLPHNILMWLYMNRYIRKLYFNRWEFCTKDNVHLITIYMFMKII